MVSIACNAAVVFVRAKAIAAILDLKRRGRLGRVERTTEGWGIVNVVPRAFSSFKMAVGETPGQGC